MKEIKYKNLNEIKIESKLLKRIKYKSIILEILPIFVGLPLLFVNLIIVKIVGIVFIGTSIISMLKIKDYRVVDIFENGFLFYNEKNNEEGSFVKFENVRAWKTNTEKDDFGCILVELDDNTLIKKQTFQTTRFYSTLRNTPLFEKEVTQAQLNKLKRKK